MDDWVIWLVAAVVLAAGEIATTSFFLGPFAIGALIAAVAALLGAPAAVAWVLFAVSTGLTFAFVRPVARRHLQQGPAERTGTAALIGRTATVLERGHRDGGSGHGEAGGGDVDRSLLRRGPHVRARDARARGRDPRRDGAR